MRTKTGCATCRARRKKCDEGYPSCKQCIRLNLVCEGYGNKWKLCSPDESIVKKRGPRAKNDKRSTQDDVAPTQQSEIIFMNEVMDTDTTSMSSKNGNIYTISSYAEYDDSRIEELDDSPDDTKEEEEETSLVPQSSFSFTIPPKGLEPFKLQSFEMDLLKYHVDKIAVVSVVNDNDQNPLRTLLIPFAMESACVRKTLCAVVAKHISFLNPEYEELAIQYYSESLNSLSKEIILKNDEEAILATAMLCTFEVFDSGVNVWLVHIRGLAALLRNYHERQLRKFAANSLAFNFCLNFLFIHDVLACVTIPEHIPTIEIYQWNRDQLGSQSKVDYYVGRSRETLFLLADLAFIRHRANMDDSYKTSNEFINDICLLNEQLLQLDFSVTDGEFTSSIKNINDPETINRFALSLLADAYRYATLVFLHKYAKSTNIKIFPDGVDGEDEYALKCLEFLTGIPEMVCCESTLVYPLFVAGCVVKDKFWRNYTMERFKRVEKNWRIGNCARAIVALGLVWESGNSDWVAVLQQLNWLLVLT